MPTSSYRSVQFINIKIFSSVLIVNISNLAHRTSPKVAWIISTLAILKFGKSEEIRILKFKKIDRVPWKLNLLILRYCFVLEVIPPIWNMHGLFKSNELEIMKFGT